MTNEEFIDHVALTTLVESLRKATHPMSFNDPYRLTYLAYETAAAMFKRREEIFTELADKHLNESDLNNLNLTLRTLHIIMADGIFTIDQLTQCTENQILRIPNLSRKMLNEIKAGLLANGLKFKENT